MQAQGSPDAAQDKPRSKAEADIKPKPISKTYGFRGLLQGPYQVRKTGPEPRSRHLDLIVAEMAGARAPPERIFYI